MTLLEFVTSIGDRWARGLDPTSTGETYGYGLKLRVLPALGHLPVTQITAGIIDYCGMQRGATAFLYESEEQGTDVPAAIDAVVAEVAAAISA